MDKESYFNYLNDSGKQFEEMIAYANEHHVPIIQSEGLNFIKMIIKLTNTKKILEIGSAIGFSAISFASTSEVINVTTIERDELMAHIAKENIAQYNLDNRINLIVEDALVLDEATLPSDFDLLFIDAAKSQYQKFFIKYTKNLKKGGIVVTDNLIFHDLIFEDHIKNRNTRQLVRKIKNYSNWLKENEDFETTFFNIGDGISVSIKK